MLSPCLCLIALLYLDLYVLGDYALVGLGLSCEPGVCVSWSTSELRMRLASRNSLSPPVNYFTDRSKVALLLWIFNVLFLSCVCYACVCVYLYVPCGHLLEKGWPLVSRLWWLIVSLSRSHWYPGSGVLPDCIDSWSLRSYLLLLTALCFGVIFFLNDI